MSCIELYNGQDSSCKTYSRRYYQQVVLINKNDVYFHDIEVDALLKRNRIRFSLKEGKSGVLFKSNEGVSIVEGLCEKTTENNVSQYRHVVNLPIFGVDEEIKSVLKSLDSAFYFAIIQFADGTVEVLGFEYGLTTDDYEYNASGSGGTVISLVSSDNGLEDDLPYVYVPLSGSAENDFNNLFKDITFVEQGSFNLDFNNDFNNL